MAASEEFVISVGCLLLEVIACIALFIFWYRNRVANRQKEYEVEPLITEFYVKDPNTDVGDAIRYFEMRAAAIMPLIAALIAVSVVFSLRIVAYYTLFPLFIAFMAYYFTFSKSPHVFYQTAPRAELIKVAELSSENNRQLIARDIFMRKKYLRSYFTKHRSLLIGHMSFVAAVLTFIVGSIFNSATTYSTTGQVLIMSHTVLLSYIAILILEIVLSWHKSESITFTLNV